MFNIQSQDSREIYKTALYMIAEANNLLISDGKGGLKPDISKIDRRQLTQGYLCLMCDVSPSSSILNFTVSSANILAGSPNLPVTRILSLQDSFIVGSMSYFLTLYNYGANGQGSPVFTTPNMLTPYTYPSQTHDGQQLYSPIMDPGMSLFWSTGAYISIEVDKKVVIPYWPCIKHLYVPETQASSTPSVTQGPPFQWPQVFDQYDGATTSFYPVEPTVIFGGGRENIVKLNLPANVPATIAPFTNASYGTSPGFVVKATLLFYGILAQNSTSVK